MKRSGSLTPIRAFQTLQYEKKLKNGYMEQILHFPRYLWIKLSAFTVRAGLILWHRICKPCFSKSILPQRINSFILNSGLCQSYDTSSLFTFTNTSPGRGYRFTLSSVHKVANRNLQVASLRCQEDLSCMFSKELCSRKFPLKKKRQDSWLYKHSFFLDFHQIQ